MAAEYSRDLAVKARAGQQRVVGMGFHMGPLPAFGYRRCSVSADGARRVMLERGQRKVALTDRIEWVLGPNAEVDLVRRMCKAYAAGLQLEEISGIVKAEGWRTDKSRVLSTHGLKSLLQNEALIGNFVWGVKSKCGKVIQCSPTRMNGSVPRIIDDASWAAIQVRLKGASETPLRRNAQQTKRKLRRPRQLTLALTTCAASENFRRTLGTSNQLRNHTRELGRALCAELCVAGLPAAFDTRTNVLTFWDTRIRIRLMWPMAEGSWILDRTRRVSEVPNLLVARMNALYSPLDFFLLSSRSVPAALFKPLHTNIPRELRRYCCTSPAEVLARISAICAPPRNSLVSMHERLMGDDLMEGVLGPVLETEAGS